MNKKRPFLKLAIQKIESLFYKNKDNPVILSDIKNELNHRKTSKAKALKDDVNKASESIDKSDILQQAENNSELLLKSISLVDFVKDYEVPVRLRNAIIAEADFIEFNSIYDFITSSKENQQHLNRLPNLGKKSLNDLISAIEKFTKQIEEGKGISNIFVKEVTDQTPSNQLSILKSHIDESLKNNLSATQVNSLKNIPLSTFVMSFNGISTRTKNAILKATDKGLCEYQNLFDFYIATDSYKENLLNLDDFGKGSLKNLIQCVNDFVENEELLVSMSEISAKSSDVSMFSSIKEIVNYAASILDKDNEQEVVRLRHLQQDPLTLQEIGDRMGVTRERVRQVDARAVETIGKFILGFSQEDLDLNFRSEINNYFFADNYFISDRRAKILSKIGSIEVALYVESTSKSLGEFLNEWFFYSTIFKGWFVDENIKNKNEDGFVCSKSLTLEQSIEKSEWPITLSSLSGFMCLPECVIKDMVHLSDGFYLEELQNGIFVKLKRKMSVKSAVRYVLRRYKKGMSLEEVKSNCLEMFGLKLTVGAIGNALGDLPDGLIVDTGTYALYENLNISDDQVRVIRNFCKSYLLENQRYISAFVIFNNLKRQNNFYEKYGALDNGHILFGICQDDSDFVTRKGFMLGLNHSNFTGEFVSLTQEIVNLMTIQKRPLSIKEITGKLSATRSLMPSSLQNMLENSKNSSLFEKVGNAYSLIGSKAHTEVEDEDFFEFDVDEI